MSALPHIPQQPVSLLVGDPIEGNEVIPARIVIGDAASDVELCALEDGEVEFCVRVPAQATPDHDLTRSDEFSDDGWRAAGGKLVRRIGTMIEGHPVKAKKHVVQVSVPKEATETNVQSLVIGLVVGNHTLVTSHRKQPRVNTINIVLEVQDQAQKKALRAAALRGNRLAQATCISRDLANVPSNFKTPEWLGDRAQSLVEDIPGVKIRLRDKAWLKNKGFGGILAVGGGSRNKPVLIEMEWDPERVGQKRRRKSVLLVGKGITFDSGGLSIKPASGMETMRTDMTGGASVLAAFQALARQQVPRRVVALIPAAENMVDAKSYRPGDIVEHYGGLTTEVSNTDAEGRMVMADAIAYGIKRYRPSMVTTVATLTGAAKVALGLQTGAVFAPDWGKGVHLARRGAVVGERWWPMPFLDYLEDNVESKYADIRQTPAGPGAVTAAMFLRRFTNDVPFFHLDIAGPGRAENTVDEITPLGTGFGARTLINWLAR